MNDLRNVPGTFVQIIKVPKLFKVVNLIDIRTKYFGNFRWFEVSRVNLSHGSQNWFELSGFSRNRGFEKSWVKLQSLSEASPRETRFGSKYREFRETEGSRNRDSTVLFILFFSIIRTYQWQRKRCYCRRTVVFSVYNRI